MFIIFGIWTFCLPVLRFVTLHYKEHFSLQTYGFWEPQTSCSAILDRGTEIKCLFAPR